MNIWLAEIWRAWRASIRKPGFLLLASGVLALGIGSTVAVFALIQNTLLRPSPLPQVSRVVVLGELDGGNVGFVSKQEYQRLANLDGVASTGLLITGPVVNIAGGGAPEQVTATYMDRSLLPTLGLRPALGRNFTAAEDRPHGPPAVLISHTLWLQRYGGDANVVGRSLQVEGVSHLIVGVLPSGFNDAVAGGAIVLPLAMPAASREADTTYTAIARLQPRANAHSVGAEVDARLHALYRTLGSDYAQHRRYGAESFDAWRHQNARSMLGLFLVGALLVLLIAQVNLVNLMLLRMLARGHDMAVRHALGASTLRLVLPAFGEGMLVGTLGALFGMLLAQSALALAQGFIPAEWLMGRSLRVGASAWALALAVGLLGGVLAALLGLWRSRRGVAIEELREGGRSGAGRGNSRLGRGLVVAQVMLAVVLLCAAGMIARALYDAAKLQLGFVGNSVLTFELAPSKRDYPDATAIQNLSQRLAQRLRTIPGVVDAVAATNLPSGGPGDQFNMGDLHLPGGKNFRAQYHGVEPGYFQLFGIALREGRGFTPADRRGAETVAVVSQDLADRYYGGHALGQLIQEGDSGQISARIVGVVGATYQMGPLQPGQPVLYLPLTQVPDAAMQVFRNYEPMRFALKVHGNADAFRNRIRQAVAEVAPGQPVANVRSMQSIVRTTTADARLSFWLIGLFASLALLLAVAGLYGVMAVAVAAREREFSVRMALGAAPSRLLYLVVRGGLIQVAMGLAVGLAVAIGVSRLLSAWFTTLLGRSDAFDPSVALGVCVVLGVAGLLACALPALRAARVQPMRALRGE